MKAHRPAEGECRVCGITTVRTLTRGDIYLREGRVLRGAVGCQWVSPEPDTLPAPANTPHD